MDIQELKRLAEGSLDGVNGNGYVAAANSTTILYLISRIEELEKAIKPFADFNRSLPEYCYGESDIQSAWPEHTPVISRSYPLDMHHATYCALYVHDFKEAAIAKQGGKND